MNAKTLGFSLLLASGLLGSCAPSMSRITDAGLKAFVNAPTGTYQFDCNPAVIAKQTGQEIDPSKDFAITCPSTDGKASLSVALTTMSFRGQGNETSPIRESFLHVLVTLPGAGGQLVSASGIADKKNFSVNNGMTDATAKAQFNAKLGSKVTVDGSFQIVGKRQ